MLRRVLYATSFLAVAMPAMAVDYSWTGWYTGLNLGGGTGNFNMPMTGSFAAPPNTYSFSGRATLNGVGFAGGGQFGYNMLFPSGWLIGAEADADATTINPAFRLTGPLQNTGSFSLDVENKLDFLGTARARVGYVMPEQNILIYGTGGLAYGGVGFKADLHAQNGSDVANAWLDRWSIDVGWSVGAGLEYPMTDRISLRAEYLYADLGSHKVADIAFTVPNGTGSGSIDIATRTHIGRLAINYALN